MSSPSISTLVSLLSPFSEIILSMARSPLHAWPSLQPCPVPTQLKKVRSLPAIRSEPPCFHHHLLSLPSEAGKDPLRLLSFHLPSQEHFVLHGSSLCFNPSSGPFLGHSIYPTFFHQLQTMSLALHTSPSLPGSLQSTAFPCCLFSSPFHALALHRLASGPSFNLNYDLHMEVATNGHFHPHPVNLSAVLDQTD